MGRGQLTHAQLSVPKAVTFLQWAPPSSAWQVSTGETLSQGAGRGWGLLFVLFFFPQNSCGRFPVA